MSPIKLDHYIGTILFGAKISHSSNLEEKFISNQERFEKICKDLKSGKIPTENKLEYVLPIILSIVNYKFVPENDLNYETMLNSAKLATEVFLEWATDIPNEFKKTLQNFVKAKKSKNSFEKFDALSHLSNELKEMKLDYQISSNYAYNSLIETVWGYVFTHYYWLESQNEIAMLKDKNLDDK